MRVLHVIPSAAAVDGGPNLAVRALARGLVDRGLDVTVATTNAAGAATLDVHLDTPVIDDGVVYRYFPRTLPGAWKFSWPLTRWLWANTGAYDVVHVHALFSYATIPGCRAAAHAPVPYVLRPLGTLSEWSLGHRRWKKRPYYALLERSHLENASAIHVTSDAEADDVARLGYGALARVVPLGVEVDERAATRSAARGRSFRVLFLSRLHPKKNVPLLLAALTRVASTGRAVELTIAGDGEPAYRRELVRLASDLGVRAHVRFAGHVSGDAKRRLLAEADCFVLPSSHENFGIAVAEALGSALPVIVTPGVALAPAIGAVGAGLVTPAEPAALAESIRWMVDHPDALADMGHRAWRLARADFSWDRSCGLLVALYEEVVGRGPHDRRTAGRAATRQA